MADGLAVTLSNPRVRVVETDDGPWFVSGFDSTSLERLVRTASSVAEVQRRIGEVAQNATLIRVAADGEHAETLHAYRSPAASRELYYLTASDGTAVVTDHFRTALAELVAEDRTPSRRAIADHLLFRAPITPGSFVAEIRSLGQGEWLRWNDAGDRGAAVSDRLRVEPNVRPSRAVGAIDDALAATLATAGRGDRLVNLFSGGVDSTLLHTYLDGSTPALSAGIDSPEYAYEMEYAEDAAALLGAPHERVDLREEDVLERVERGIEALGSPSYAFPTVLVEAALREGDPGTYAMAVGADALFGMEDVRTARIAAWLAPVLSLPGVYRVAGRAPRALRSPYETLATQLDRLERDPADPLSFPQQAVSYTTPELAGDLLGEDLVARRCRRLVEYVRGRVVGAGRDGTFAGPAELAHLVSFYGHRIGSRYRQLAVAHGKPLLTPFETERMMRCSLSIPAERRYVEGLRGLPDLAPKYLLKALLKERLPGYDTAQEKGSGVLPYERYRSEGALRDVFETYDVPAFVPRDSREEVLEGSGRQAWNLLTYAIWRDRVLDDPDLEPVEGTRRFEFAF